MNLKHILYAVSPFIAGCILKKFIFSESINITYLSCVGISCVLSLLAYSKIILPNIERNHYSFKGLDGMNKLQSKYGMENINIDKSQIVADEQNNLSQQKPYTIIAWLHVLVLIGLIASYFIN